MNDQVNKIDVPDHSSDKPSMIARFFSPFHVLIVGCFTLVAVADRWLLHGVSLEVLYLIPILLTLHFYGIRISLLAILISVVLLKVTIQSEDDSWTIRMLGSYWELFTLICYDLILIKLASIAGFYFDQAERLIERDRQTGLLNHDAFLKRIDAEINRAQRLDSVFSVVYIDLDQFKALNDSLGHVAGNSVINLMRMILSASLRDYDHAARMGGDEFAILLPETSSTDAKKIMQRLLEEFCTLQFDALSRVPEIKLQNEVEGVKLLPVTFSSGIVTHQAPSLSANEIVHAADRLMSLAKQAGSGQLRSKTDNRVKVKQTVKAKRRTKKPPRDVS